MIITSPGVSVFEVYGCRNLQKRNEMLSKTQVQKRHKPIKPTETGKNFIIIQGEEVSGAPWTTIH